MEDRIQADPDVLVQLAERIQMVNSDLASASVTFGDNHAELRSSLIEDALDAFSSGWSDKRAELVDLLTSSETVLRQAAEQFAQADQHLASALDAPSTS